MHTIILHDGFDSPFLVGVYTSLTRPGISHVVLMQHPDYKKSVSNVTEELSAWVLQNLPNLGETQWYESWLPYVYLSGKVTGMNEFYERSGRLERIHDLPENPVWQLCDESYAWLLVAIMGDLEATFRRKKPLGVHNLLQAAPSGRPPFLDAAHRALLKSHGLG